MQVPDGFDPASVPVVADGTFVVVGRAGAVIAIDVRTWKKTWARCWPDAVLDTRPVISDGVVLFADCEPDAVGAADVRRIRDRSCRTPRAS